MEALNSQRKKIQIGLDHLKLLTDDVGIIQHAFFGVPRRHTGYTTDDNARALIAVARYSSIASNNNLERIAATYLSFLHHAQETSGLFRNFMNYDRTWIDTDRSEEDALARSFLALAEVRASGLPQTQKNAAANMLDVALPAISEVSSPHAVPVALIACAFEHELSPDESLLSIIRFFADRLCRLFESVSSPDWQWFEPYLTYSNARMPHALFSAYRSTQDERFLDIARRSTSFLTKATFVDGILQPIGNHGWYPRGGERAYYDQQPVDTGASVELYVEAFRATGDRQYYDLAHKAYSWYLGDNPQHIPVADPATGACYDALKPDGVNLNQGAEACVTFLMAALALRSITSVPQ
jgi:uncharacterized protein YyaL (SSP411 family)